VLDLFSRTDLAATNSDARRLVAGGGAWIGDRRVDNPKTLIDSSYLDEYGELILRAGKKRYFRIIVE
jgi:tyrosyl-tRNA synthetase